MTRPRLVVPIRDFDGYTRLSSVLTGSQRRTLAIELADRMHAAAAEADLPMRVVSGSDDVRQWAGERDVECIHDPGLGLDAACVAAVADADCWVVAHADLPGVNARLLALITDLARDGMVIVPSADGGTNVIGGNQDTRFSFGPGSFHRHLAAHPLATIVVLPGVAIEVDTPLHLQWLPRDWLPSSLQGHDELFRRAP